MVWSVWAKEVSERRGALTCKMLQVWWKLFLLLWAERASPARCNSAACPEQKVSGQPTSASPISVYLDYRSLICFGERERERDKERKWERQRESERDREIARESLCVCVGVWVRVRKRKREGITCTCTYFFPPCCPALSLFLSLISITRCSLFFIKRLFRYIDR